MKKINEDIITNIDELTNISLKILSSKIDNV